MIHNSNMSVTNSNALKKRLCPKCCEPLKAITVGNSGNINSTNKSGKSSQTASSSIAEGNSYRTEFQCTSCRLRYSLEDLKKIEQSYNNKKTK